MGQALGWREMAPQYPNIDGQAFNDGMSRNLNRLTFSFNLCMHVRKSTGYWNYGWFVDMQCGPIVSNNRKVKDTFWAYNKIIGGQDYYQHTFNGNFHGTIDIGGKDTYTTLRATFHDTAGNWGNNQYWNVSIPTASSMSNITKSVTSITQTKATITGKITSRGNYSNITRWRITCNGKSQNYYANSLSYTATFTGLRSETTYNYTIEVWSTSGYYKSASGSFKTKVDEIGYIMINGRPRKVLTGYVVTPDKRVRRITKVRKVNPA